MYKYSMLRERRRELIAGLLRSGPVGTQEEIVDLLARQGTEVTQATVSRDLAAIGAIRGPQGYALDSGLAINGASGADEFRATVRRHVVQVDPADSLVVIRTAPGHAGLLGAALDRRRPEGVVGTIAGDDTVFLATQSRSAAAQLTDDLRSILEFDEGPE
jgi:transcriptional regulator of arginine metabolism